MDDSAPVIRVQNLVKRFGDVAAVDDVSFEVRRGEVFAFLGPNGAGKTTTIRMLTTLLRPTGGSLQLDGLDPAAHRTEVRRRIGVVFQDPSLDLGGATVALFQGVLILGISLVAGFRPSSVLVVPLALAIMLAIAVVFAAMGTIVGSSLRDMQGFPIIMNFLVMPIFFLSGALYPLRNLPAPLAPLTRLDPLTYGVDALRGVLIGTSHFSIALDVLALGVCAILLFALGAYRFSKIEV